MQACSTPYNLTAEMLHAKKNSRCSQKHDAAFHTNIQYNLMADTAKKNLDREQATYCSYMREKNKVKEYKVNRNVATTFCGGLAPYWYGQSSRTSTMSEASCLDFAMSRSTKVLESSSVPQAPLFSAGKTAPSNCSGI